MAMWPFFSPDNDLLLKVKCENTVSRVNTLIAASDSENTIWNWRKKHGNQWHLVWYVFFVSVVFSPRGEFVAPLYDLTRFFHSSTKEICLRSFTRHKPLHRIKLKL